MEPTTYEDARSFLAGGRDKDSRPVANNTRIETREDGRLACKYHATDVVTYHPDGSVTLDSEGWLTTTTKDRFNRFSGARVWSEGGGTWAVYTDSDSARYEDGLTISPDGSLQAHKAMVAARSKASPTLPGASTLRARIRQYARDYAYAFVNGSVGDPGPGDCWGCLMRNTDGKSKGEWLGGHLTEHMDEPYYVPSLLWNAIQARGYRDPSFIWQWWRKNGGNDIPRTLTRYMYAQLGLVV